MQELHLVGYTTDRRHLIFSARRGAKSGSFLVPVDDELLAAVDDLAEATAADDEGEVDEPVAATPPRPRVEARLSVREVQARLRAGDPIRAIASEAGVDEDWVERFAPPVWAEQRQVVERALQAHMERPRAGASSAPLRRAVAAAMAERGVPFTAETFDAAWSSRLVGVERWLVEFSFVHRGRKRTATWTYDADSHSLTTTDRTASQIGFVAAGAEVPPEAETIPGGTSPAAAQRTAAAGGSAKPGSATTRREAEAAAEAPTRPEPTQPARPARKRRASSTGRREKRSATAAKKAATKKRAASKKAVTKKRAAPKKGTTKKRAPSKKAATKKRAPSKKAATKKRAASKKAVTRKTATKKRGPSKKAVTKKRAPGKAATKRTAAKKRAASKKTGTKRTAAKKRSTAETDATNTAATSTAVTNKAVTKTVTTTRGATKRVAETPAAATKQAAEPAPAAKKTATATRPAASSTAARPAPAAPGPVASPRATNLAASPATPTLSAGDAAPTLPPPRPAPTPPRPRPSPASTEPSRGAPRAGVAEPVPPRPSPSVLIDSRPTTPDTRPPQLRPDRQRRPEPIVARREQPSPAGDGRQPSPPASRPTPTAVFRTGAATRADEGPSDNGRVHDDASRPRRPRQLRAR